MSLLGDSVALAVVKTVSVTLASVKTSSVTLAGVKTASVALASVHLFGQEQCCYGPFLQECLLILLLSLGKP